MFWLLQLRGRGRKHHQKSRGRSSSLSDEDRTQVRKKSKGVDDGGLSAEGGTLCMQYRSDTRYNACAFNMQLTRVFAKCCMCAHLTVGLGSNACVCIANARAFYFERVCVLVQTCVRVWPVPAFCTDGVIN